MFEGISENVIETLPRKPFRAFTVNVTGAEVLPGATEIELGDIAKLKSGGGGLGGAGGAPTAPVHPVTVNASKKIQTAIRSKQNMRWRSL